VRNQVLANSILKSGRRFGPVKGKESALGLMAMQPRSRSCALPGALERACSIKASACPEARESELRFVNYSQVETAGGVSQ